MNKEECIIAKNEELEAISQEHAKKVRYYVEKAEWHLHQIRRIKEERKR